MAKYVVKRILLMLFTLFVITTICFMLIRMLPRELPQDKVLQEVIQARWDALGYNKPLLVQYGIYLKNIFTAWDFGTSWYIEQLKPAWDVLVERLLPTVLVNLYSLFHSPRYWVRNFGRDQKEQVAGSCDQHRRYALCVRAQLRLCVFGAVFLFLQAQHFPA